jgi:hypothetical protein
MTESDSEHYKSYCVCLGEPLKEYVTEAQERRRKSKGTEGEEFYTGYLCAFHRIITLMQQEAEIFDIPFEELGIDFKDTELIF